MRQTIYSFSQGLSSLLVLTLLSILGRPIQAQTPGSVTTTQSFSYTGQIVTWTVPTGVTSLTIESRGAEGGDVAARTNPAGKGAVLVARVDVSPGQSLSILVGQQNSGRGAGGGGSFVVGPGSPGSPKPLVIAGGGGGAGAASPVSDQAKHGQLGQSGGAGGGAGGNGGAGGEGRGGGGGGGGLLGDGGDGGYSGAGGKAFINGGAPGNDGTSFGSFGGGGAGQGAGAGAGGYSGGGTGGGGDVGGGGGSITTGDLLSSRTGATDGNSGNGLVIISYSVPTQPIRYVKQGGTGDGTSWANASGDLQSQINSAGAQQVWVAAGRYTTTANLGSFLLKNGVAVYGGFAGSEQNLTDRPGVNPVVGQVSSTTLTTTRIVQAVISNDRNGLDNTARLDGFVITGGNTPAGNQGGGIYNNNSNPSLTNLLITGNTSGLLGGGMYNDSSSPVLTNCLIRGNSAQRGGGIFNFSGSPVLINCTISGNTASNQGGGISSNGSSLSLTNCTISGNTASNQGGGIYNQGGSPVLTNCLLSGNTATNQGGAMHSFQNSTPRLLNCTLTGNSAGDLGGAISEDASTSQLTNAILWNNGGAKAFRFINNGSTSLTYSLIESGATGYTSSPTNQTATVSPFTSGTDFTLRAGSQAIDAGDPASTTATSGTTDLAGNPRVLNNRIDQGAYEFQGPFCQPIAITQQPVSGSSVCVGSTITAIVSVTGTSPTYQWYKDGTSLGTAQQSATLTLTNVQTNQSGSYSVVVTGSCNSVTSTAFSLTVNALPVATIMASPSTTLSCAQTSLTLMAGGGDSYVFSGPGILSQSGNQAVVNAPGTYSMTVTSSGCTSSTSIAISQDNSAPVASLASSGSLSCGMTSVTLTASPGGQSYIFSAGATQIGNTNQAVVTTGDVYSVTVVSGNGCSAVAKAVVFKLNTPPVASLRSSGNLSCGVSSVTLTASPAGLSYTFSAGATQIGNTNQAVVNTPGLYLVTVVSGNGSGCSAVAIAMVSQDNTAPSASLVSSGSLSCGVASVTLTASPNGSSYVFSRGATQIGSSNQALVSTPGLYSVTVLSSNNGCSAVAQTTVVSTTAVVSVTTPTLTTAIQGVAFSQAFTAGGGTGPYSYSLVSGSLPPGLSLSTTGILAGTPTQAGSFTLTVSATDANGCSGVSTPYTLTISEPVFVGTLRLIVPLYNCQTGAITFRTVGGNGSGTPAATIEYRAIGVTDWTTNPNQIVDLPVRQDANAQPLLLQARQNGVMVSYTFDFRVFCNSTVPNQPPVFTQPPTQTATLGQAFAYRIPDNTFRDLNGTAVNFMAMNLPAGLSYAPDTRVISGVPTAVGSYSVTLSVSDPLSLSASGTLVIQVNPVAQPPVSTTVNQAPVFNGPLAAKSGTVGSGFTYTLPVGVFTDPNAGDVLTYQASGLPAGLSFNGANQTISGTPTTAGTYSVTLTATDGGGLSASGTLTITISTSATPPPTGPQPLAVIQPLYNCQTGAITFRTTGGDGTPIYFTSVGIVGYSTQTSYVLEAAIRNDANSQPLLIKATQSGVTTSYRFDFRLYCNGTVPTPPPVFTGPLPVQQGQVGVSFNYQLSPNSFTALNGGTLNYSVTGLPAGLSFTAGSNLISGVPTQAGSVTATITATDPLNQSGQGPLVFVITPATQPPVGAQPLTLVAPLYDCGTGAFTFRSSGGDGSPIEYFAVGITGYTTLAGPYTVRPAGDAQPFTLKARQSGVEVTFTWDFKAVCSGSTRLGVAEITSRWTVKVLGNPVTEAIHLEIQGAMGQELTLTLTDVSGRVVLSRVVSPETLVHQEVLAVEKLNKGLLLLRVSSVGQSQTVKVLGQ